jgi:hypothetical protein
MERTNWMSDNSFIGSVSDSEQVISDTGTDTNEPGIPVPDADGTDAVGIVAETNAALAAAQEASPTWLDAVNIDNKKGLEKFKSIEDLAKSYKELESKLGSKESSSESLGMPKSPEDYKWEAPEGTEINAEFDKKFRAWAHENQLTQKQFENLQQFGFDIAQNATPSIDMDAIEAELKESWSGKLDENLLLAKQGIVHFEGNEVLDWTKRTDVNPENDPVFLRLAAKLGESLQEHEVYIGKQTMGKDSAQARVNEIIGNLEHPYYDGEHPGHKVAVDEVHDLLTVVHGE